ncbi:hypothetical protein I6E29_07440 [Arcanobacterium haemolyticum]|nr:hypothetical protein [Arcanobacterium haemolyticum]
MTVQLTTIDSEALTTATCGQVTEAYVGIDLTILGAHDIVGLAGSDFPQASYASFPKLASCASAACDGGLDLITLSADFRSRLDGKISGMDAVHAMSKLAQRGSAGFSAEVPADPVKIREAIDSLSAQKDGWGCIELSVSGETDVAAMTDAVNYAHDAGVHVCARLEAADIDAIDVEALAGLADSIRLGTDDPHTARECRFALRSAAAAQGRELPVLIELGVVISGSQQAANERELLIHGIRGCELFAGRARVVGTVYDVADEVERWIGNGAADGVILLPASLPTDLASVIRGVLPLLRARADVDAA